MGSLPNGIRGTKLGLRYNNGLLNSRMQEMKREMLPNPAIIDGDYDDTDYVKSQGCFYPGSMLSSKNNTSITAGILLRRQHEERLTVAIHNWDEQLESKVELGDAEYTVKQGDWTSGIIVGRVTSRIGSSDIGLAKVDRPFSNRFLDLNGSATSLLHSKDATLLNTKLYIDGFVTGPQQLVCAGLRFVRSRSTGDPATTPKFGPYLGIWQGIYATSAPEIIGQPKIREGVCGAAVLIARDLEKQTKKPEKDPKTPTKKSKSTSLRQPKSPKALLPRQPRKPKVLPLRQPRTPKALPLRQQKRHQLVHLRKSLSRFLRN